MSGTNAIMLEAKYRTWAMASAVAGRAVRAQSRIRRAFYPGKDDGQDTVILIHGLWMGSSCMRVLGRLYAQANHRVVFMDYLCDTDPSAIYRTISTHVARANALGSRAHLVGHSCGGVLAVSSWLQSAGHLAVDSILCLGSPLNGSQAARRLLAHPAGKRVLGRTGELLVHPVPGDRPNRGIHVPRIAMLAGTRPVGAARWLGAVSDQSDGTVELAETRWPGLDQHVAIDCTHRGLVHWPHVAALAVAFTEGHALPTTNLSHA